MEPFGLLNFLKTLLPADFDGMKSTPDNKEEAPPTPPIVQEEKENAYLHFIETHEKRAKRK